jgi:hypothetical protein
LWKVTNATIDADYATGTSLGSFGNVKYRFIHADGYKIVVHDVNSTINNHASMSKGIYTVAMYYGDQIQLANNATVDLINNKVDILQTEVGNIMDGFDISTDSLHAISTAVAGVADGVLDATVEPGATVIQSLRLSNSVLGGKVSGAGTGIEKFRDLADTLDRVTSTVDNNGNRTTESYNLT